MRKLLLSMLAMICISQALLSQQRDTLTKNERHRVILKNAKIVKDSKDMCKLDTVRVDSVKIIKIKEDEK